ncbi:hypothetical protein VPH35_021410 [Triticum aestivum]
MGFIDKYWNMEAHGNTKLHVIHTNDKMQMATSLELYAFASFSIASDKTRLERVNLEVANFVDVQKEWRVSEATKELDSLADVAGLLIDDYNNNMKKKITNEEHRRGATLPLTMKHIEYAAKDAYAVYKIWNRITLTQ